MKAVRVSTPGGLEALQIVDVPDPKPGPGELTLEIKAASINHLDLWVRKGLPVAKYPMILGSDGAGMVRVTGGRALLSPPTSRGSCEVCPAGENPLWLKLPVFGKHRAGTQAGLNPGPADNPVPTPGL